jgi:mono/diheme cytochrome c family protein
MKKLIALFALAALPALAQTTAPAPAASSIDGKHIFETKCQGCHGADGAGHTKLGEKTKLPDFSSAEWQKKTPDNEIVEMITEGSKKNSKMKAYKTKLSKEEIDAVAHYIRGLGEAPAAK